MQLLIVIGSNRQVRCLVLPVRKHSAQSGAGAEQKAASPGEKAFSSTTTSARGKTNVLGRGEKAPLPQKGLGRTNTRPAASLGLSVAAPSPGSASSPRHLSTGAGGSVAETPLRRCQHRAARCAAGRSLLLASAAAVCPGRCHVVPVELSVLHLLGTVRKMRVRKSSFG